tara:strand:+ start:166 stop:360 length:195 start_codon:yes stop_codon:yes gene_type:complete
VINNIKNEKLDLVGLGMAKVGSKEHIAKIRVKPIAIAKKVEPSWPPKQYNKDIGTIAMKRIRFR